MASRNPGAFFDAALADGVFGVPPLVIDGVAFWGEDAIEFAEACLVDRSLLDDPEMRRVAELPASATRA